MSKSFSASYAAAGVDITAGYRSVELMKKHVARTKTAGAIDSIGGFGGLFLPQLQGMKEPILVSGTDGVGTKLKIAFLQDKHDTIGVDCVAMCVNDIICCGAQPLFFLDYIACGRNVPERIAEIVGGVAEGCVQSGAALIGGETAEHPGMMPEEEYDLAGFAVGVVDREKMFRPDTITEGDVLIALPSTGVHSNGFSLVRKVFTEEQLAGELGRDLLVPTRIYVKDIQAMAEVAKIKACAHITGGGFYENIPRALPDGICAAIRKSDVRVPEIFHKIAEAGNVPERDMYNTYNMGVGMMVVVPKEDVDAALAAVPDAYVLGVCESGEGVRLW